MNKLFNIILLGCLAAGVEMELEELDAAPFEIKATANHEDGIYKAGEPIVFSVQLFDNGKVAAGHKLSYVLRDHDALNEEGVITTAETPITLPAKSLQAPGWLFVHFTLLDENGKTVKVKGKGPYGVGALVEPEKFVKGREEPADFDAFWTAQKERLKTVPLKELERVKFDSKNEKHKGFDIYDVKVSCVGDMPVSGYLTIPQGAQPKSLKAVVFYHGAGVRSSIIRCMPGAIVFDVNAHGIINGQPLEFYTKLDKGELADYRHRGCMQRETVYYLGMYLRMLRALEYVRTQPEWNGKDLIVKGHSQGGAQAIAAASLDPLVTLCLSNAPGHSDHASYVLNKPQSTVGFPRQYKMENPEEGHWKKLSDSIVYFDTVHFAKRLKCPTYMAEGFADATCIPPQVFAVYNNIPATVPKHMHTKPTGNHGTTPDPAGDAALKALLKAK